MIHLLHLTRKVNSTCLILFTRFSPIELVVLNDQLETYIIDMRSSSEFFDLKGIGDLAQKIVETKKYIVYPLVYLPVTLTLILPLATANVERTFCHEYCKKSTVKSDGISMDERSIDCVCRKYIFDIIDNETIMQHFQYMKTHQGQL